MSGARGSFNLTPEAFPFFPHPGPSFPTWCIGHSSAPGTPDMCYRKSILASPDESPLTTDGDGGGGCWPLAFPFFESTASLTWVTNTFLGQALRKSGNSPKHELFPVLEVSLSMLSGVRMGTVRNRVTFSPVSELLVSRTMVSLA